MLLRSVRSVVRVPSSETTESGRPGSCVRKSDEGASVGGGNGVPAPLPGRGDMTIAVSSSTGKRTPWSGASYTIVVVDENVSLSRRDRPSYCVAVMPRVLPGAVDLRDSRRATGISGV